MMHMPSDRRYRLAFSRLLLTATLIASTLTAQALGPQTLYHLTPTGIDSLGSAVVGTGDLNGDGFGDFAMGFAITIPAANTGFVRVYSGRDGTALYTLQGDSVGSSFGAAIAALGDIDGDAVPDLVVGAPHEGPSSSQVGRVHVFSGRTGLRIYRFDGDAPSDYLGGRVAGLGDVDGDGCPDVAAGANGSDYGGENVGYIRVYSGRTGTALYTLRGDASHHNLGAGVANAGDINNDGRCDFIAGTNAVASFTLPGNPNYVRIYSGQDGSVLRTILGPDLSFGHAIAGGVDVSGDGVPDLVIGHQYFNGSQPVAGRVLVISGADGSTLLTFVGDGPAHQLGETVAFAGDVDRDGHVDIAAGFNIRENATGSVRVYSGRDGSILHTFDGVAEGDLFGARIASAGDVNADGYADIIASAPGVRYGGAAFVLTLNAGATPVGTDVFVKPIDTTSSSTPVTLTFDSVTAPGVTTVTTSSGGAPPPAGFRLGSPPVYYEVSTTATFGGSVEICIDYSATSWSSQTLELLHRLPSGDWEIITTDHDTVNKVICGSATSLSPFMVAEAYDALGIVQLLSESALRVVLRSNMEQGLVAILDTAARALADASAKSTASAIRTLQTFVRVVEAQSGRQIAAADAGRLIAIANLAIELLSR